MEKSSIEKDANVITAIVTFGMPSKDCSYSGICRIEPEGNFADRKGICSATARIALGEKNQLIFRFEKERMSLKAVRKYFGSGHFIVIEAYQTPEFVCKALGRQSLVISPGVYPLTKKDGIYEVEFNGNQVPEN